VLEGFWLDIKIFVIVEIVVLALGLMVAIARSSRAPAFFPLRLLAASYADIFRGVPTILVVYLIGFGIPALTLPGLPDDPVVLGGAALALSYSAYVAGSTGRGSTRFIRISARPRWHSGSPLPSRRDS
jgi:polar amino acid transport system permease protein